MKKVLLHICCGVCASWPVEKLRSDGYEVAGFFYDPNIQPEEEYIRRLTVAQKVSQLLNFDLIEGKYDPDAWFLKVKGLETEAEGGLRCTVCFQMRLEETARMARKLNIPFFTSTLTVSPHKNAKTVEQEGGRAGGDTFLKYDFKKQDGFKKTHDFAKQNGLYCQNYCGCRYSIR
ncbi:MAG: epoxyqueuosine reductase QueH [Candidatus Margulisiibacteriota bacterium]